MSASPGSRRCPAEFDARFSAIWRRYTYRVCDDGIGPDPLDRWSVLPWHRPLRIDALNEASATLVGEHDFAAFCKQRDFGTTVRAVQDLRWDRDADGLAVMTVQADAFCHSMVRSLVGVLLPVGDGRRATTWPAEILRSGQKHSAVTVMPAFPLVLEEVGYPADDQLLERQRQTRSVRSLGGRPGTAADMGHIDVQHVTYGLPDGRVLLDDVSFRVPDGSTAALVGANGAGKTTLHADDGRATSSRTRARSSAAATVGRDAAVHRADVRGHRARPARSASARRRCATRPASWTRPSSR